MDTPNQEAPSVPAEVVANGCRVRYRRIGSGRPVILFRPAGLADVVDPILLDGLAARFRVLVPVGVGDGSGEPGAEATLAEDGSPGGRTSADGGGADPPAWMSCFVEGLGMADCGVIAAGAYRAAVLQLAAALPDQLTRVVLVHVRPGAADRHDDSREPRDVAESGGSDGASSVGRAVPWLEVHCDAGRAFDDLPRILEFLDGEGGAKVA